MTVATATPTDNNPCKGGPGRSADCVTEWISSRAFCASEVQGMTNRYCAVDKNIDYKILTTNTPHCVWDMETSFDWVLLSQPICPLIGSQVGAFWLFR